MNNSPNNHGATLLEYVDYFIPEQLVSDQTTYTRLRAGIITSLCFGLLAWLIFFNGFREMRSNAWMIATGISASIPFFLPIVLKISKSEIIAGLWFVFGSIFGLTSIGYFAGFFPAPVLIWIVILPIGTRLIFRRSLGYVSAIGCIMSIMFLAFVLPSAKTIGIDLGSFRWQSAFAAHAALVSSVGYAITGIFERLINSSFQETLEAKQIAEEAVQARSRFLAMMSHEIRTPLNSIVGFSQLIEEDAEDAELKGEFLENSRRVRQAAESLTMLLNTILDFARYNEGNVPTKFTPFYIPELLEELQIMLAGQQATSGITINVEFDQKSSLKITQDRGKIQHILMNLLSNAIKYSPPGSEVDLIVTGKNDQVTFWVRDNGTGIDESDIKAIFQPFEQGKDGFEKLNKGSGLGLTIARLMAEAIDGKLNVESEQGKGSIFSLQISDKNSAEQMDVDQNTLMTTRVNRDNPILIVDDNPMNIALLKSLLTKRNFNVLTAENGDEAIDIASTNNIQLVFMDIHMPGKNGFDTIAEILSNNKITNINFVMLSADEPNEHEESAESFAEILDYMTKPIDKDLLYNLLDSIYDRTAK